MEAKNIILNGNITLETVLSDICEAVNYADSITYGRKAEPVNGLNSRIKNDIEALKAYFNISGDYFKQLETMKATPVDIWTLDYIVLILDMTADYFDDMTGDMPSGDELCEVMTVLKGHFDILQA